MPYIIKTRPIEELSTSAEITVTERALYEGCQIARNDEVFIWFNRGAQEEGLAWRGHVESAHSTINAKIIATVRLLEEAPRGCLTITHLEKHRNDGDGTPLGELARKLYRHAHSKIAGITDATASWLRDLMRA